MQNLREVVLFPMNQRAEDLLMGAPSEVTPKQLATLNAAIWGAELALGDGPGRIYIVEPTGPIVDDPNLTDKKFPG
jgi:hypothetical protein